MSPRRVTHLLRPLWPKERNLMRIVLNHSAIEWDRPVAPVFNPGDALIFDAQMVHATQFDFGAYPMTRMRHAIETWFHPRCTIAGNGYSNPLAWGW
eukprot:4825303-Prymnesium_polylepis.1